MMNEKVKIDRCCIERLRGFMREIKFRGKSKLIGEWLYGYYYNLQTHKNNNELRHMIVYENDGPGNQTEHEPVIEETVGQYIGLNDIRDKEIYVGDLLKDDEGFIWEVLPLSDGMFKISCDDLLAVASAYPRVVLCEVIGNIYENQ